MVTLSAAVMAHPVREPYVKELLNQLDRDIPVIYDQNPTPSPNQHQRWTVAARAWRAHDPNADMHLVLQDDIHVSQDLITGLETALDQLTRDKRGRIHGLVSAYAGTGRPNQPAVQAAIDNANTHDHTWWDLRSLYWGPAIIAPTWTIPRMLTWCSNTSPRWRRAVHGQLDFRIGCYYRDQMRWRCWYPHPSLVEHRGLPSLVGNNDSHTEDRYAHKFHPGSALDIDWTRTPPGGLTATRTRR